MDLMRTTDHVQSLPGFSDQYAAPRDSSKLATNLSKHKSSPQALGRASAGHSDDPGALNRRQSTDTLPSSGIARLTLGLIKNQRHQLAHQPSSSRDTHIAEHYKASYVLEDRGGATAPGAELSLRPTGKAAGGMEHISKHGLQSMLQDVRRDIEAAQSRYENSMEMFNQSTNPSDRRRYQSDASRHQATKRGYERQYDSICAELEKRSARSSSSGY